jgi:hypothetical protein
MTPSALTPAARGTTKKSRTEAPSRPSAARGSGHRSNLRRSVAPTAPRRVSGPAGGSGGVIAVPAPGRTRPTRERPAPSRERTAPSRRRSSRPRPGVGSATRAPWALRTVVHLRALPDHVLLDRIIRGRVWIPLLGVLLAGIVFMQVEVLKLNAGIGRSLERGSALQAQNELLRAGVSRLSDDQRIERLAAQMGMVMPAPEQLRFVKTGNAANQRALGSIHAPNATGFIAQLPTPGAPAAAQGTAVNNDVGVASTGAASTTSAAGTTADSTGTTADSAGTTADSAATTADSATGGTTDTSAGTTSAPTTSATGTSTPQSTPTAPAAPTTSSGSTDQSAASSSGGAGATPVGG